MLRQPWRFSADRIRAKNRSCRYAPQAWRPFLPYDPVACNAGDVCGPGVPCNPGFPGCAGGQRYEYDEENRVTAVYRANHTAATTDDDLLAEYEYDALGRRIHAIEYIDPATGAALTTPKKTRHVYVGIETVEEYNVTGITSGQGDLLREFVWGDPGRFPEPVAMVTHGGTSGGQGGAGIPAGESVYHYLHDVLGSVVGLTDLAGVLVERYTYDPYGRTLIEKLLEAAQPMSRPPSHKKPETPAVCASSRATLATPDSITANGYQPTASSAFGNPFLWTGQRYDAATGLYAFLFRTYSPSLGRWLQRDPAGYVDGANLYQHVSNRPMNQVDPFGLSPESDWLAEQDEILAERIREHRLFAWCSIKCGLIGEGWNALMPFPLQEFRVCRLTP